MTAEITDNMFSQPRLGGPYGSNRQGNSQANGGPGSVAYYNPAAFYFFTSGAVYTLSASGSHTSGYAEPAKPAPHEGIRVGEIEAWRAWRVNDNGFLTAITADLIWAPNEAVYGDIEIHGIHAFKRASEALTYVKNWGDMVVGRVALWGEVVEHEDGYRAEWAKPLSLEYIVGKKPKEPLDVIRKRYGLPIQEARARPRTSSVRKFLRRFWKGK